ncbi:outward-rectifier potassium channel TOK1 [Podospora aff. communis PSN243]|uniref:Outward-rectifier potassium channel TOK1 n=1 Tax=Podospora aff. communis PSN243 TaxID=3040156 RepID=A0AAV9H072_9PEZI|nr:outward-rectifier potassium channel TOK1 [Podospora aff. communis PSN243]
MNDASGERIDEHVRHEELNAKKSATRKDTEPDPDHGEHEQPHLNPSRWWYASSAFPLVAATLGPVASSFSICALVKPWRQYYPPNTNIDDAAFVPDPAWLTIINGIQLLVAIIANLALLLNMTRRLRFAIAQPITIVGWYISSIALICLTATAAGPLIIQPAEEYIWAQSFYYAMYSAILYFVVSSLMVVTFMGAHTGKYPKDFNLTPSQRTLMLQTIMFQIYLLLGALVFCNVEGWDYLDAVYWAAVTLFTVGFGDFYATTTLGRALLIPYALIGIISLGLVIGSIRSLVLERGRRRFDARVMERKRQQMLRSIKRKGKDDILVPIQNGPLTSPSAASGLTEFDRREAEFKLMRKIQEVADWRRRWYAMAISASTWLVLWLVGAKIFQECEDPYQGWTYFDAFYFAFVSLTTIGYGDITPVSNGGKSFWVFWALLALPTMTVLISNAGDTIVRGVREATDQVGMVTILPGERGFKKDLKKILRWLSFGKLFQEDIEELPPGFLGSSQPHYDSEEEDDDMEAEAEQDQNELDPEAAKEKKEKDSADEAVHGKRVEENLATESQSASTRAITFSDDWAQKPQARPKTSGSTSSRRRPTPGSTSQLPKFSRTVSMPRQVLPEIPTNKADYHLVLIQEIGRVMQHLKSNPPRKYTFPEWAWYLRLSGEDEGNADKHHEPHARDKKGVRHRLHRRGEDEEKEHTLHHPESWSWVGSRSPLMGSKEEAEWILERLTKKLEEELRAVSRGRRRSSAGLEKGTFRGEDLTGR